MSDPEMKITVSVDFAQQSPEVMAWKSAHAMMWQRWQDFIDFPALKKRHLELPVEWRFDALFDAIGMLYGEYLTAHINEYHELEVQLLEQYRRELKEKGPGSGLRAMALKVRFQVSGRAECCNCPAHGRDRDAGFFTEEIVVEDDESARDVFLSTKRLCERCLPETKVNLQFDRERLSVIELGPWK